MSTPTTWSLQPQKETPVHESPQPNVHVQEMGEQEVAVREAKPERLLADPVPHFLSALRGYNRQQVLRWASWQQKLLARTRARLKDTEAELARVRSELERALVGQAEELSVQFRLPPGTSEHAARRRPGHLRRERRETAADAREYAREARA
ncbi:MAG: hypothetical protein JWM85_1728 [Acidimicrobiaceae bacterium]|nr:hypothetical protein [Acidimicrobiaceae bacterium]